MKKRLEGKKRGGYHLAARQTHRARRGIVEKKEKKAEKRVKRARASLDFAFFIQPLRSLFNRGAWIAMQIVV